MPLLENAPRMAGNGLCELRKSEANGRRPKAEETRIEGRRPTRLVKRV